MDWLSQEAMPYIDIKDINTVNIIKGLLVRQVKHEKGRHIVLGCGVVSMEMG